MKLKKRFKTVLGAIMAAVMVVTAVPVTGGTVQAAQTVQTEETTEETTESLSEETVQSSEEQTEEQQQSDEEKTESQADEEMTEERETQGQSVVMDESDSESGTESISYNDENEGDSADNYQTGHVVNGKSVTFTYVDSEGQYTSVGITGSMTDPKWSNTNPIMLDEVLLNNAGADGENKTKVWQKTLSYEVGDHQYQFIPDNQWVESNRTLTITGLLAATITAVKGQETVLPSKSKNHVAKEQDEDIDVVYAVDTDNPLPEGITFDEQNQSVTISEDYSAADTEFILKMTDKNDSTNTSTIVVIIQRKSYSEDPSVKSPVVGKGEATFYYFGPTISLSEGVKINYGQGSSWQKKSMTFNDETGYWWITLQLAVGTYEYGFLLGSQETWELDPLNNNKAENGNTIVIISEGADDETYLGPTINYNPSTENNNDPGAVTFYFDGSATEAVVVKGAWDVEWKDIIKLGKDTNADLFSVEIPTSKLTTTGTYEYGFGTGSTQNDDGTWGEGTWNDDYANPHIKVNDKDNTNSRIYRNPQVDLDNNVTLYYYPSHGAYPDKVMVKYREKTENESGSYNEVEMTRDTIDAAVYSVTINNLEINTTYEYYFEVTTSEGEGEDATTETTKIEDTNNATVGEFELVDYPDEPEGLTSPVVDGNEVTFNYYNPQAKSVVVVGEWTDWQKDPVEMKPDSETGVWSVTCTLSKGEHKYKFIVDSSSWITDPKNDKKTEEDTPNSIVVVEGGGVSEYPAIDGKSVTFSYVNDDLADDEQVSVVGSMNGWTKHVPEYMMEKNSESGEWELTITLSPGVYSYKFFYGDSDSDAGWKIDPRNTNQQVDGNNQFYIAGLADGKADIAFGKSTELPDKLELFDVEGKFEEVPVTYEFSAETAEAEYKDRITLDGINLSITEDFPEDVKSFTLTAADENGNTAVVTVSVVEAVYTYTIYYYDRDESHRSTDASALWIWNEVADGETSVDAGIEHNFDEAVELSDGNTWLKASVKLSYTGLGIIPKSKGKDVWTWEESTRKYTNSDEAEEVTLYIVSEDGTKIYTELPEIKPILPRYLIAEYTRTTQTDADWYFYTWNSGYGSDVFIKFEDDDKDGTGTAVIPVKQGLSSISFCLETPDVTTGEHWGDKDGSDYLCAMPVDQNIVKVKIEEGRGITYVYPYNTGYEIEPAEKTIHFYYRDDDAFLAGSDGGFASVSVEIAVMDENGSLKKAEDGTLENLGDVMSYNTEEQRYKYDMADLESGTYYYRYLLKENEDSEGIYVLDGFNDNKETIEGAEYSVCAYEFYDAQIQAFMQNDSMDYNDNNVLTVALAAKDSNGEDVDASDIVSRATVDLSAVGGRITEIDPALMQLSIAVKDTTSPGTKILPITVYDLYNNEYNAEVSVNITSRTNTSYIADDFDWDEAVIYFTVTDRFFDGNSSNNNGEAAGSYDIDPATGCSSYHGGDFAGLTQKLDYLEDLGVNTIWITPIVENQLTANSVTDSTVTKAWGYHGYWAKDFNKLDAHLGTEAEFKALLDAAHARGIKIMVDVVLNHSGYGTDVTSYFNNYPTEDGTLRMLRNDDETVSASDQQSSLSGLPDFRTEDPEVRALLVEWQSNWISKYDIDYYRVDTVKHVDETTWSAFKNALTQINPDFKMIGEYSGGGYATDAGMLRTGRMDSLLDFDFNDKALSFVSGDISAVEDFLRARNAAIDNTATLGAFLSSHDEDGFVYKLTTVTDDYKYGKTKEEAEALAKVAASLQLTTKGQVVIYYGEEIGLTGAENYPYNTNRYDFDWSQTEPGANNTTLSHYKKMLSIRNRYSTVLAKGSRKTIAADNSKGLDVFARSYGGTTLTVALNISGAPIEYTLTDQKADAYLFDYYSGMQYQADANGEVTITVPAAAEGGTVVLAEKKLGEVGNIVDLDAGGNVFDIDPIVDQTYTGKNIVLTEDQLKVYDGLRKMKLGTDYTVSYKNNKNAGTATITVKGKGNYSGTEKKDFEILPRDVADKDVTIQYNADLLLSKKVQKPITKITYNGMTLGTKDYLVSYYSLDAETGERGEKLTTAGVKDVGDYEMVITGKDGNYTGEVVKKVTMHEEGNLMSKTKITLTASKAEYTGYAIKPGVTVKQGKDIVPSENYTVSYTNNVNIGTATVTITGNPGESYYGSVVKTFKITGKSLSSVAKVDTAKWQTSVGYDFSTGKAEQPQDALILAPKNGSSPAVVLGTDYTIAYSKNTAPGTATVTFTGKGLYTGTIKKTFKITSINLANASEEKLTYEVAETAPYAKKGAMAAVTVKYDGVMLQEGVDYKLTYSNNKAVTTENTTKMPSVKITGIGKFTGVLPSEEFSVVKANLAQSDLSVADVVFQDKAGKFISIPVLDGAKIKAAEFNTEYYLVNYDDAGEEISTEIDKEYTAALNDTIRVKVAVTENNTKYEGETTKDYRVVKKSISSASVKIQAKTYTGNEIKLTEEDFTKIKMGSVELKMGTDYEIIDSSYINNVNKGTASVTIRGIGEYGGTKKVTFKITSCDLSWISDLIS